MSTYLEEFRNLPENAGGEDLTQEFIVWDEEGKTIAGKLLKVEQTTVKEGMDPVNRYVLFDGEKTISCLLGGATDKQMAKHLKTGDLLAITYNGKQKIRNGTQEVNLFAVRRWGHEGK